MRTEHGGVGMRAGKPVWSLSVHLLGPPSFHPLTGSLSLAEHGLSLAPCWMLRAQRPSVSGKEDVPQPVPRDGPRQAPAIVSL